MGRDCNDPRDGWHAWRECNRDDCCDGQWDQDFFEEDEDPADLVVIFENGEKGLTAPPVSTWIDRSTGATLSGTVAGHPIFCGRPMHRVK